MLARFLKHVTCFLDFPSSSNALQQIAKPCQTNSWLAWNKVEVWHAVRPVPWICSWDVQGTFMTVVSYSSPQVVSYGYFGRILPNKSWWTTGCRWRHLKVVRFGGTTAAIDIQGMIPWPSRRCVGMHQKHPKTAWWRLPRLLFFTDGFFMFFRLWFGQCNFSIANLQMSKMSRAAGSHLLQHQAEGGSRLNEMIPAIQLRCTLHK